MRWVVFPPIIGAIVWASLHHFTDSLSAAFEVLVGCLAVAGAVLTADAVIGRRPTEKAPKIDWVGVAALLIGLAAPMYMSYRMVEVADAWWWHPWLLPSYGAAFLVCLVGRAVERKMSGA
jgi:hypothetical protein